MAQVEGSGTAATPKEKLSIVGYGPWSRLTDPGACKSSIVKVVNGTVDTAPKNSAPVVLVSTVNVWPPEATPIVRHQARRAAGLAQ